MSLSVLLRVKALRATMANRTHSTTCVMQMEIAVEVIARMFVSMAIVGNKTCPTRFAVRVGTAHKIILRVVTVLADTVLSSNAIHAIVQVAIATNKIATSAFVDLIASKRDATFAPAKKEIATNLDATSASAPAEIAINLDVKHARATAVGVTKRPAKTVNALEGNVLEVATKWTADVTSAAKEDVGVLKIFLKGRVVMAEPATQTEIAELQSKSFVRAILRDATLVRTVAFAQ